MIISHSSQELRLIYIHISSSRFRFNLLIIFVLSFAIVGGGGGEGRGILINQVDFHLLTHFLYLIGPTCNRSN